VRAESRLPFWLSALRHPRICPSPWRRSSTYPTPNEIPLPTRLGFPMRAQITPSLAQLRRCLQDGCIARLHRGEIQLYELPEHLGENTPLRQAVADRMKATAAPTPRHPFQPPASSSPSPTPATKSTPPNASAYSRKSSTPPPASQANPFGWFWCGERFHSRRKSIRRIAERSVKGRLPTSPKFTCNSRCFTRIPRASLSAKWKRVQSLVLQSLNCFLDDFASRSP
jgi:hypothetical protein